MKKKSSTDIRLGTLEMKVMQVVWDLGKAAVWDVKDVLGKGRKPAYTTILTTMRTLETKGYLKHVKKAAMYIYSPVLTREQARQGLLSDMVERLFDGSSMLLVNCLVEKKPANNKEMKELRQIRTLMRGKKKSG